MLRTFFVLCLLSVLITGCEKGVMPNVVDVMTDITTEEVVEIPEAEAEVEPEADAEAEAEIPMIELEVEYESPGIPEGVDILESDRVFHVEELDSSYVLVDDNGDLTVERPYQKRFFEPFVFEDAVSALTNEDVLIFFAWWELDLARQCEGFDEAIELFDIDFWAHFSQREEADKFAEQFEDISPWSVLRNVYIINGEEVYFAVRLSAFADREICE